MAVSDKPHAPIESAGARVPFPPPLLYIGGLVLGFALHIVAPTHVVSSPSDAHGLLLFGGGLLVLSAGLVLASVASFRQAQTTHTFSKASTSLIVRGPFRISRNPLYLAGALFHGGLSLLANALWPLVLLLPALAAVNALIRREEDYLAKRFGAEYEAYCKRVRRWL